LKENLERANLSAPIEVYDVDEDSEIANEYGIRNLPTMILLDGNTEIGRSVGLKTTKQLKEWVGE
jgi:thioredoxin-like negative regulator of GroEL